ncbi:lipoprotein insertase outer membrane protein LolB [Shewanella sp. AS1]|uniref:lipoprotein insertase outer membrane protein LolB n=1 Tax=Shewanella sp. AS1 TaxID=2907626 RepID=UPI001F319DD9|nr:lipoprotein insertase outer membrane protein LolB [Shewanella sp. AS1]MCE9679036.1 lipoprotein insertase outer membrane protein LolB [Shewanella sp. AS1]
MNNLNYFTKFTLLLLLPVFVLAGCSSQPKTNLVPTLVESVDQASAWEMQGKLALKTPQDKFSTNLYWLHSEQEDKLRLTSMLGTSLLSLDDSAKGATLMLDDKTYQAQDAEQLLQELTGWSIPINKLPLWITGQAGEKDLIISKDAQSRPKVMQSWTTENAANLPWQITFKRWQTQSGAELPRLLELTRGDLQLKIQINHWQALTDIDTSHKYSNSVRNE